MTRLFNVRLSDEEYALLGRVSTERGMSMSALVKDWVNRAPVLLTMEDVADSGKAHLQCDERIADLEGQVKRLSGKTPVSQGLDTSSGLSAPVPASNAVSGLTPAKIRPSFLAAPDDDCGACGHDRQLFHLDGACKAPAPHTKTRRCGCETYVNAAEPF